MSISLILLVKNGAKHLNDVLMALEKQTVKVDEMVIVDSGSRDGSLYKIKNQKSKIKNINSVIKKINFIQIKPEEFSHGGTRNFAVSKTSGDIIVFLSQDAVPQSTDWLKNLLEPFGDIGVVGVFGRQIPWPETNICEKFFYSESYPDKKRIMAKKDSESFSNKNIFFSNVNGAARRDLLLKYPFRNDLVMSEDQFWGREVLKADYQIVYEPKAGVWHSHNYNLIELFKRYIQSGYSQKQMNLKGDVFEKGIGTAVGLLSYVLKNKPWLLPYAVIYEVVKGGAFLLGRSGYLARGDYAKGIQK